MTSEGGKGVEAILPPLAAERDAWASADAGFCGDWVTPSHRQATRLRICRAVTTATGPMLSCGILTPGGSNVLDSSHPAVG